MTTVQIASNPFALMLNPEVIFAAMESSDRLARLTSRVWRPLDKPLIAHPDADMAAFDESVETSAESAPG